MPPERVRDSQCQSGDDRRKLAAEPQSHQQVEIRYRKGRRSGGHKVDPPAELPKGDLLGPHGDDMIQRVGEGQPFEALKIVVPHAILEQPAILPHRPGRATDGVQDQGAQKNGTISGNHR
jgi:hypothetical protein